MSKEWWRRTICSCFDAFDEGKKGFLVRGELVAAMTAVLGVKPSRYEVLLVLNRAGRTIEWEGDVDSALESDSEDEGEPSPNSSNVKGVLLGDFESVMADKVRNLYKEELVREAFREFDTQNKGFITREDALSGFRAVFPSVSSEVVCSAFAQADTDKDARVGLAEFYSVVLPSSIGSSAFS